MHVSALAILAPLLTACYSTDSYLISAGALERAAQLAPAARQEAAVPALRIKGTGAGARAAKATHLRLAYLPPALLPRPGEPPAAPVPAGAPAVRVTVRAYNPMVTAGAVLTCVGSVLSVAGSIWFFATLQQGGDLNLAGGLLALAAEPPMWVGAVLWPLGLMRPPYEARPGPGSSRLESPNSWQR